MLRTQCKISSGCIRYPRGGEVIRLNGLITHIMRMIACLGSAYFLMERSMRLYDHMTAYTHHTEYEDTCDLSFGGYQQNGEAQRGVMSAALLLLNVWF